MVDAVVDRLTILEAKERHGTIRKLVRMAEVSGIVSTDWDLLEEGLDSVGFTYGSKLSTSSSSSAYGLVLTERNPTMIDKDRVRVELVYENTVDLPQDLDDPFTGAVLGEVRCNIGQKTSNLDIDGDQVSVSHTYPADDPNHPDETLTQGGEFSYFEPQQTVFIRGTKATRTPWLIANNIVGHVNNQSWAGQAARKWLCTGCTWKTASVSGATRRYFMDFEFQFDRDGWDPTVVFIDDVTGKPPPNLVADVGYKTVEKMPAADFDAVVGSPIQGG
jgi:hypothetical protein